MYWVACGATGLGDWIWETESGRPLGISEVVSRRESRLDEEEVLSLLLECLDEDERFDELVLEDLLEDSSGGTSRMFKTRPVVGSVVDDWEGSWETWYPSMM